MVEIIPPAAPRETARVRRSTNQSFTTSVEAAVTFDTVDFDFGGYYSAGSPTRFTIPSDGRGNRIYLISGYGVWAANSTGIRSLTARLNGTTDLGQSGIPATGNTRRQSYSIVVALSEADYVELTGFQSSGGNLNLETSGSHAPHFSIVRVT